MGNDRAARVAGVFDRLSAIYDTKPVQAVVYRPPQDAIIAELRKHRARRIADVGCGTGILASRAVRKLNADIVYGCDPSGGMLERARARSDKVIWLESRSESLPIEDHCLDAVVSSSAFHFFDQPSALREFHRVLIPGGRIMIVAVNPQTAAGRRLFQLGTSGAGHFPDARQMHDLVAAAGFAHIEQRRIARGPLSPLSPDVLTLARTAGAGTP